VETSRFKATAKSYQLQVANMFKARFDSFEKPGRLYEQLQCIPVPLLSTTNIRKKNNRNC